MRYLAHFALILALASCTRATVSRSTGAGLLARAQALRIVVPEGSYTSSPEDVSGVAISVENAFLADSCVKSVVSVTSNGLPSPVSSDLAVSLQSESGTYYSDSFCTISASSVTIPAGSSQAVVYYQATSAGLIQSSVSAPSVNGQVTANAVFTITAFQKLAAAGSHTCAIVAGEVFCWGSNENGRLGRGFVDPMGTDNLDSHYPAKVSGLDHVVYVAAGAYQSCALKDNGEVYCWGQGAFGQIGDGRPAAGIDEETGMLSMSQDTGIPTKVVLPEGSIAQGLASGNHHSCALVQGKVYCWGENNYGQLGLGDLENRLLPAEVPGIADAVSVAAGFAHTCAIRESGVISCWGSNHGGQLGVVTSEMCNGHECSTLPVNGPALPGAAIQLTLDTQDPWGNSTGSCALLESGRAYCWGGNSEVQSPVAIKKSSSEDLSGLKFMVGGNNYSCGIDGESSLYCWGLNAFGVLGFQSADFSAPNAMSVASIGRIRYASGGALHNCAVSADNGVYCWGFNSYGQLGDGSNDSSATPVKVKMADGSDFQVP